VARDVELVRVGGARGLEEAGDAAAARDVELEAVDRLRLEQVDGVAQDVDVLARRDVEPARAAVAEQAQALEVGRGDGLLEPAHAPLAGEALRPRERLLALEGAVRVDVELGLVPDLLAHGVEPPRVLLRVS
jgi:hypothetical protein